MLSDIMPSAIKLNIGTPSDTMLIVIQLNVAMLCDVMLSVIIRGVVRVNVVAPKQSLD